MNIYNLKFGEHQWFSEMNCNVLRVPGGWLFREYTVDTDIIVCSTFVPFNNEFMEISDASEAEKPTANTGSPKLPPFKKIYQCISPGPTAYNACINFYRELRRQLRAGA